jgi:hypothetical protein
MVPVLQLVVASLEVEPPLVRSGAVLAVAAPVQGAVGAPSLLEAAVQSVAKVGVCSRGIGR